MTRRGLLAGSAAAVGLLAAACGGLQAGPATTSPVTTRVTGTPEFWHWGGAAYASGFQPLVEEFNAKQTGVTVKYDPATATGAYWDKLTAALAGNVAPDVFLMRGIDSPAWAHRGQLRDLSDFVARDKAAQADHKAALKAFAEFYQPAGKTVGWPWDYTVSATVYNVGQLNEAGLKTPGELGNGWDWNALLEHARKLTRPGDQRWGAYASWSWENGWLCYVAGHGGSFLTADRKRCVIGSAEAIEATQFLVDLIHKHRVAPTNAEVKDLGGATGGFIQGKIGLSTHGDWEFPEFIKKSQGAQWDVAAIARSPRTRKTGNITNFRALVMNPATKQPEAGFAFMKNMLTRAVQDRIPRLLNEVPARQDSADDVFANPEKAGPPPGRTRLTEMIRVTQALPAHDRTTWVELHTVFRPHLDAIWDGKIAVRDGLLQMQEAVNALFQRAGG